MTCTNFRFVELDQLSKVVLSHYFPLHCCDFPIPFSDNEGYVWLVSSDYLKLGSFLFKASLLIALIK